MSSTPQPLTEGILARVGAALAWFMGGATALILGLVVGFQIWAPGVIDQFQAVQAYTAENTLLFDRNDAPLATIEGSEDRHTVPLSQIAPSLQKAVVGIEDRRFFGHRGMDPIRLFGAIWADMQAMAFSQGGSTITQQLVKLTLLSSERTLVRKIKEIFMALALEREFSKEKILEFYLNQVYFGHGVYGVEKAAAGYFHKSAADLSLSEAAFLASLIKKPEGYLADASDLQSPGSPAKFIQLDPEGPLMARHRLTLDTLRGLGWVTAEEYAAAAASRLVIFRPTEEMTSAPYFVQDVLKEMRENLQVSRISGRGFRVFTTLDPKMQGVAEEIVGRIREGQTGADQGAFVALDAVTGEVRALVGGLDYTASQFDRVTQARRQPGSAFKPILYAAAFDNGYASTTVFRDEPVRYVRSREDGEEEVYEPHNYGERYGVVADQGDAVLPLDPHLTLGQALVRSSNVVSVQLLNELGVLPVTRVARRMGVELRPRMGLCIALGCSEVSLMELTSVYATFANGGIRTRPVFIRRITDSEGKVLFQHYPDPPERVISPWTAFQINQLLQDVIRYGTGWRARLGRPAGGKTGTNDGPRDTWFVGFTPGLVAGVWIGNDENRVMPYEAGGRTTARIWREFMDRALPAYAGERFPEPEEQYVAVRTCPITGQVAGEWCPQPVLTYHPEGQAPTEVCSLHQGPLQVATICAETGLLVSAYCPLDVRVTRQFYANALPQRICDVHTPESLLVPRATPAPKTDYLQKATPELGGPPARPPARPFARDLDRAFPNEPEEFAQ